MDARGFVYSVLTIDRRGDKLERFRDATEAYRALSKMCERWLKRLRRWMVKRGWEPFRSEWVSVVEAHRNGWPHLNILIYAPEWASELDSFSEVRAKIGATERERKLLYGPALEHATASGWGRQCTAERVQSTAAIAGYFTQLAKHVEKGISEVAKLTQLPTNAPERFRRLRSGKGFLPPRRKNPETTGALIMSAASVEGDLEVRRLNPPSDPEHNRVALSCVPYERVILLEDEERQAFNRTASLLGIPHRRPPDVVVVTVGSEADAQ